MNHSYLPLLWIAIVWLAIALFLFQRKGLLTVSESSIDKGSLPWWLPLGGFLLCLAYQALIAPRLLVLVSPLLVEEAPLSKPILQVVGLAIGQLPTVALLVGWIRLAGPAAYCRVWGTSSRPAWRSFGSGAFFWLLSYPAILAILQTYGLGRDYLGEPKGPEQHAVQLIRNLVATPWLFGITALFVAFVIPWIEELLFRGLLYRSLSSSIGVKGAAIVSSCLFALAHYSPNQAGSNGEVIFSIFPLALFLCFVYEKYQSLWAAIGLHSVFNAISLAMLLASET